MGLILLAIAILFLSPHCINAELPLPGSRQSGKRKLLLGTSQVDDALIDVSSQHRSILASAPAPSPSNTPLQYGGTVSSPFDSISCQKHVFKAGENVACNLSSCFHVPSCCVNGAATDARDFSYCFPQFYPSTKVNTYAGQNFTCPGVHYSDYTGIKTDKSDAPLPACCQEAYGTPKQGPIDTTCS